MAKPEPPPPTPVPPPITLGWLGGVRGRGGGGGGGVGCMGRVGLVMGQVIQLQLLLEGRERARGGGPEIRKGGKSETLEDGGI
jgi:hypothetical protein